MAANYLAMRIMEGKLQYSAVVAKFPQYKDQIDAILIANGRQDLIV